MAQSSADGLIWSAEIKSSGQRFVTLKNVLGS